MIRRSTRRPVGATRPAEVSSGPTCRPARRKATATESPASTTLSTSRSGRSRASCISRARAIRSTAVSETPLTVTGSAYSSRKAAAAAPLFLKKRICPQPQQLLNVEGHRSMLVPTAAGHQTALRCRPVERLGLERGGDRGPRGHRSSTATGKPQPAGVRSVGLSMYQVAPRTQLRPGSLQVRSPGLVIRAPAPGRCIAARPVRRTSRSGRVRRLATSGTSYWQAARAAVCRSVCTAGACAVSNSRWVSTITARSLSG